MREPIIREQSSVETIRSKMSDIGSPEIQDIATKALSKITEETPFKHFEDSVVKGVLFGHPIESVVKGSEGDWRVETKYRMSALMQRKLDGTVIVANVGHRNSGNRSQSTHDNLKDFEVEGIQSSQDLKGYGLSDSATQWLDGLGLSSQAEIESFLKGSVGLRFNTIHASTQRDIERHVGVQSDTRSLNRLLSMKRTHPLRSYGLSEEALSELEYIVNGHPMLFEFESMSDSEKMAVDDSVYDLVSETYRSNFKKVQDLKNSWLAEHIRAMAPEFALSESEVGEIDLEVMNFIASGLTQESVRNRLQFSQLFNYNAHQLSDVIRDPEVVLRIDSGEPVRDTIAKLYGYSSLSKKEFSTLKEYCVKQPGYRVSMTVMDALLIAKLPADYRPTPDNYMKAVFFQYAHLHQNAARNSIINASKMLDSGDRLAKKEALQSMSWIKGGEWDQALKKMDHYSNADSLSDYYMMIEKLLKPAFAHIHYTVDPDSMGFNYVEIEGEYKKPTAISPSLLSLEIERNITSYPSLLVQNDKIHKNINAILSKYQAEGEYSPAKLAWEPLFTESQEVEGLTFVPLANGADIINEGQIMNHCVGSYLQAAMAGKTFIVSVQENGERRSTMELNKDSEGLWVIGQHYGKNNSDIPDYLEVAGLELVDQMNEGLIKSNTNTGMQEEIRDMNKFKATSIAEGFDITNRGVVCGLVREAINYLPKGVSLSDLFREDEKQYLEDLESLLADEPIKDRAIQPASFEMA